MKKYLMIVLSAVFSTAASAQKVAYVDVDYVLKNMPEYTAAQEQIDNLAAAWQKDIDTKYAEIDNLYKRYEAEQVLLTDDMKQQRKKEIDDKEKAAKNRRRNDSATRAIYSRNVRNSFNRFRIVFTMPFKKLPPPKHMILYLINRAVRWCCMPTPN